MIKAVLKKILPKRLVRAIQLSNLHDHMTYAKDGLYTVHNCSFMKDNDFNRAYLAGKKTGSWGTHDIEWRVHTVLWAAQKAFKLEGDFVECGVNKGGLSRAIIDYLGFGMSGKRFYLLDTFEGFDIELLLESEKKKYATATGYGKTYEQVRNTFKEFSNVEIIKGAVPHTLSEIKAGKVAFLSIDMNCVQPEIAALDFFWPKMVSGGVIILDDFAYSGFEEQNSAHTEWAKKNRIEILTIPTGQGLIIKP
jgi:hypothetical protein